MGPLLLLLAAAADFPPLTEDVVDPPLMIGTVNANVRAFRAGADRFCRKQQDCRDMHWDDFKAVVEAWRNTRIKRQAKFAAVVAARTIDGATDWHGAALDLGIDPRGRAVSNTISVAEYNATVRTECTTSRWGDRTETICKTR